MEPILSASDISKGFSGVVALDGVGIDLHAGEVHALVGENGAGKSTLVKILTGVYTADDGDIRHRGSPVSFGTPRDAWKVGIATSYQEISLVPMMSVARNLFLGAEPRNRWRLVDVDAMNRGARALLGRYGLDLDVRRPVRSFGAGVRQMIAIVRAVSADANVVILDEPTSSLEAREVDQLVAVVERLKSNGVALLFVSHNLDEVFRISDRITILRDGSRVHTGPISATSEREVIATMLGRDLAEVSERGLTSFDRRQSVHDELVLEANHLNGLNRLNGRQQPRDVSFTVRAGEIVGLAGLLGSGRSETVRAVFGTLRLDGGEVAIAGRSLRLGSPRASIRAGVALLPEDRKAEGIIRTMSLRDNITLIAMPQLSRWGFISRRRTDALVERFIGSLNIRASGPNQTIDLLSGGNQQKALLARLLAAEPTVLLLDEPTRGIDIGAKADVQRLIQELADRGRGIVLISSELEDVVEGADRVIVLKNGAVVAELEGDDIDDRRIIELMATGGARS